MLTSDQTDQIAAALSKAQSELQNPKRNREVEVRTRTGGRYSFRYATLDSILDLIRPALAKHELSMVQIIAPSTDTHTYNFSHYSNGQEFVKTVVINHECVTRILHSSGQWIETRVPIQVEGPGNQAFGSAVTYARRYSIVGLCLIAAEEDDDSNLADGNHAEVKQPGKPMEQREDEPFQEVEDTENPFSVERFYEGQKIHQLKDRSGKPRPIHVFSSSDLLNKRKLAASKNWGTWIEKIDAELNRRTQYEQMQEKVEKMIEEQANAAD